MVILGHNQKYRTMQLTLTITYLKQKVAHIREYDDTKNNERIYEAHKTGTSYEISPDGTKTDIIKGDHYNITYGKSQALIEGQSDITIGGRHKVYINKDGNPNNHYDIQIGLQTQILTYR